MPSWQKPFCQRAGLTGFEAITQLPPFEQVRQRTSCVTRQSGQARQRDELPVTEQPISCYGLSA